MNQIYNLSYFELGFGLYQGLIICSIISIFFLKFYLLKKIVRYKLLKIFIIKLTILNSDDSLKYMFLRNLIIIIIF